MARMDKQDDNGNLIRALIYGSPKSRKTWWALKLAEQGFNVILADLDDGAGIAKVLDPAALANIFRIDMRPNAESYGTSGAATLSYAMSGQTVFFDEADRKYVPIQKLDPERQYLRIDLSKATPRDVLVIDTWTAFVLQMTSNTVTIKSPIQIEKLEWEDYQKVRLVLDHFLTGLTKLDCHVIVVGHSETYAKKKPGVDPKGKKEHELIESVRIQPSSVSRAHAETMAGKFNEVLYFENRGAMLGTRISTKGTEDFDAGSRFFAPADYKFEDLTAAEMLTPARIEAVRGKATFDSEAVTEVLGADMIEQRKANTASPTISVGAAAIKEKVTSGLLKR